MAKTIGSDVIQSQMGLMARDPRAAMRVSFDLLENLTDGDVVVVDASNPFAYSLEMAAITTHYGLLQGEALGRRLYPSMAKTQEDLYLHMADVDYLDRFATPAETVIGFVMPLQEIYGKAVPIQDGTGAKALVIPRHTSITAGNLTFTLQYPVVIKVLFNNTISISMDLTNKTPTYIPTTNIVDWSKSQLENNDWVVIDVPVQQVKITSYVQQLTSFTGYSKTYTFDDQFYYARAYKQNADGTWAEISVTHQQQVYNPNKPTVCLKVLNNSVEMYIPQIYFQNGSVKGSVRLDIYSTKGKLNEDLSDASISTFKIKFADLDTALTEYSTPFSKFANISAMTRTRVTGGTAPLSFSELLTRVTSRSTITEGLPISDSQMGSMLKKYGYDLTTTLDNITMRQYTAGRDIPPPTDATTVTGLGCSIQLITFTIDDLDINPIVFDSTRRATITPTTLMVHDVSGIRILDESERAELNRIAAQSPDGIANIVNNTQYHFSPFHYVFDMSLQAFAVRPYYMTAPTVTARYMFQQNDGLGLNMRSDKYGIQYMKDGSGYKLALTLTSNASINAFTADRVSLQLSYLVPESTKRAWLEGTLISPIEATTGKPVNNEWVFTFDIMTTFDITSQHQMDVSQTGYPVGLTQEFDVLMVVKDFQPTDSGRGDIDTIVSKNVIPDYDPYATYLGATQEKIVIKFGSYLEHLWRRSRTIIADEEYLRYEEDIAEVYPHDVYKPGPDGRIEVKYDYESSTIVTTKIHNAGDAVLDPSGNPVYRYRKGDIIYDNNGDPISAKSQTELARQVDLFLVDGRYYFATNELTTEYLDSSLTDVANWITTDIRNFEKRCIERTNLYFYPKSSTGMVDVIVGDGAMARLKADQSLRVVYTLRKEKYKNAEIRENLTKTTPTTLKKAFETLQRVGAGVFTKNDLTALMKELMRGDIVDVEIHGFLDDLYTAVLLSDVSSVPTIGKKLVTLSNLTLQVQDDVEVEFEVLDKEVINPYTLQK